MLKPYVSGVEVCNLRKNALLKDGSKSDRIDANKLSEQLYINNIKSVYHAEHGLRTLKELARSYLTISKDLTRVMIVQPSGPGSFFEGDAQISAQPVDELQNECSLWSR